VALTLSVAMCTYNHAEFLGRALEALVSQSRPADEIVVVDDGSSDSTPEVLARFAAAHPSIRAVRNEQNRGVLEASKRAQGLAQGDFLYAASSDDYLLPGAFERLLGLVERNPSAGIAFGKVVLTDPSGRVLGTPGPTCWTRALYATPEVYRDEFLSRESAELSLCSSMIFRRAALAEIGGFRPELGPYGDTFAAHALGLRWGACYAPQSMVVFRANPGGFARRIARQPGVALGFVDRIVDAMRSPPCQGLFPETYVQRWAAERRRATIDQITRSLRDASDRALAAKKVLGALGESVSAAERAALLVLEASQERLPRRVEELLRAD